MSNEEDGGGDIKTCYPKMAAVIRLLKDGFDQQHVRVWSKFLCFLTRKMWLPSLPSWCENMGEMLNHHYFVSSILFF